MLFMTHYNYINIKNYYCSFWFVLKMFFELKILIGKTELSESEIKCVIVKGTSYDVNDRSSDSPY